VSLGGSVTVGRTGSDWFALSANNTTATFGHAASYAAQPTVTGWAVGMSHVQAAAHPPPNPAPVMGVAQIPAFIIYGIP
jgi:hypothetical protein